MTATRALADHFLTAAGIAAICIEADGEVTAYETVGIDLPPGIMCYCCRAVDLERLADLARECSGDPAQLVRLAADLAIGLTPHEVVVDRAFAAVDEVQAAMKRMQAAGEMQAVNRAFKAARAATPSLRYRDHLEAFKLKLIEAMAVQVA